MESVASLEPNLLEVHRDIEAGGVRLRATEWSTPTSSREAIVALHGALATRESFALLGAYLARDFRFIAVDLPGFGESEKPSPERYPYGPGAFGEAITHVFSGLSLGRAHLLGHCLGGTVAVHLAAKRPELVRGVGLIAPLGRGTPLFQALAAPIVGGLLLRQLIGQSLFRRLYRARIRADVGEANLARYYEAFSEPRARLALLATLRRASDPRLFVADGRRLRLPTLLLWGREDRLYPVEQGRLLAREIPSAGLSIVEGGHAPHEERPSEVASLLRAFYRGERAGLSRFPAP